MSVFADTSALYALLVANEDGHENIAGEWKRLLGAGRTLMTTSYVLVETMALLQHRIGLAPVRDFDARIAPLLKISWVSEDLHLRGLRRMLAVDRRRLSLVDCVSFEFMEMEGLRDVLTLDTHFAAEGFHPLPT